MGRMDVQRVDEIIPPVNEADDFAGPLGDAELKPASRDIIGGAVFARIGLRRSGRDGGAPCRVERAVEDGDEGGAVSGARGADVEGGSHWFKVRDVGTAGNWKMVGIATLLRPELTEPYF